MIYTKHVVIIVICTLFYGAGSQHLDSYASIASLDNTAHINADNFTTNVNWNSRSPGDRVGSLR
eukprot:7466017-Pyramimonas_sp.AAC.1